MIEEYKFGRILIDGQEYQEDVEVRWMDEVLPWPKEENHLIGLEDVARAVAANPEVIIIGTGESGLAEVLGEVKDFLQNRGIKLIVDHTEQATKTFNIINDESLEEDGRQAKVIGLFHLTC
jgi:hypothetical protein